MQHILMLRSIRAFFFVVFLSGLLTLALRTRPLQAAIDATCDEGTQTSGALYRICMPISWNGTLTLYAHGYVSPTVPLTLPVTTLGGISIEDTLTGQGYAFATTSYSRNGLAVEEGVADLVDLLALFQASNGKPNKVLLVGVSEGALITTLTIERHPQLFDAGMALCGPYGDFRKQVEYMGDFRVLFDYFFPGLLPPTPINIPTSLIESWETDTYSNTIKPQILDSANITKVNQLLTVAGAAFDANDSSSKEKTISDLLWYNVFSTNDAKVKLTGQPFANQDRDYQGSADDVALNADVQRFEANQDALNLIEAGYQTTGNLRVPLITAHTSRDPVVPSWHMSLYRAKVEAAGSKSLHTEYQYDRYGHCNFQAFELQVMFFQLNSLADTAQNEFVYLPVVNK